MVHESDGDKMTDLATYSIDELLTVTASRELAGKNVVFAGIGLPTLAVSLAQETSSPNIEVIYESGVCGAHPATLPATIADSVLITDSEAVLNLPSLFGYVLQGGRIDVGFLGAAQIDKFGNLNSSVIGDWHKPSKRLPGSGGAHEVLANAKETFVIMRRHSKVSFVNKCDFITSAGPDMVIAAGGRSTSKGVTRVFTQHGVLSRDNVGEELTLTGIHAGIDVDTVIADNGWDLKVADDLQVLQAPTEDELTLLRTEIDPAGMYLR
jgi:glutaconate CoA-transferase subunit B